MSSLVARVLKTTTSLLVRELSSSQGFQATTRLRGIRATTDGDLGGCICGARLGAWDMGGGFSISVLSCY